MYKRQVHRIGVDGQQVGRGHLEQVAEGQVQQGVGRLVRRKAAGLCQLGKDVVSPLDGAGDDAAEKADEQGQIDKAFLGRVFAPVYVDVYKRQILRRKTRWVVETLTESLESRPKETSQ